MRHLSSPRCCILTISHRPDSSAPRANKRFLHTIIRNTDEHNRAVLRAQAEAAQEIKAEREAAERREKRARAREASETERIRRLMGGARRSDRERESKGERRRSWERRDRNHVDEDDERSHRRRRHSRSRSRERHPDKRDKDSHRHEENSSSRRRRRSRSPSLTRERSKHDSSSRRPSDSEDRNHSRTSRRHDERHRSHRSRNDSDSMEDKRRTSRRSPRQTPRSPSPASLSPSRPDPTPEPTLTEEPPDNAPQRSSLPAPIHNGIEATPGPPTPEHMDKRKSPLPSPNRHPTPNPDTHKLASPKPIPEPVKTEPARTSRKRQATPPSPTLSEEEDIERMTLKSRRQRKRSPSTSHLDTPDGLSSKMDKYFDTNYDPRLDIAPLTIPQIPSTGLINGPEFEGWDAMLEIIKQRREDKVERKRLERLGLIPVEKPDKPTTKKPVKSGEKESEARWNEGSGSGIMDIVYKKKGAVREWDVGKEGF